jgi:hypothetical protein
MARFEMAVPEVLVWALGVVMDTTATFQVRVIEPAPPLP